MKKTSTAIALLTLISAAWGLTFPLKGAALTSISPSVFVLVRFFIATLVLFPFVIRSLQDTTPLILITGLILGILNCGIYVSQNIGLQLTTISHAAFITQISVLLVPLLAPLWRLDKPKLIHALSAIICLIGLYILTGANFHELTQGDLWVLLCAICNAFLILTIQYVTKHTKAYLLLTFYQVLFTGCCMMLFVHHHLPITAWSLTVWSSLLFCAIVATALALYIQMRYQHFISATQAAIIFALEPVFAILFDVIGFHHSYTSMTYIGASIVIMSVVIPDVWDRLTKTRETQ